MVIGLLLDQWDDDTACRWVALFVSEFPGNCQGSWLLCGAEKGIPVCVCVCVCVGEKPAGWSRSQSPSRSEKDNYIREVISSQNVNLNIKTIQNEIFLLKYLPHSPCFYSLPQQVATVTSISFYPSKDDFLCIIKAIIIIFPLFKKNDSTYVHYFTLCSLSLNNIFWSFSHINT